MTAFSKNSSAQSYLVYIVQCSDGTLYTGITTDIQRRIREHNGELPGGAKYTHARRPVRLVYVATMQGRASASREEHRIKRMSREQKMELLSEQTQPPAR